jgi:hypothetical protein
MTSIQFTDPGAAAVKVDGTAVEVGRHSAMLLEAARSLLRQRGIWEPNHTQLSDAALECVAEAGKRADDARRRAEHTNDASQRRLLLAEARELDLIARR